MPITPQGPVGAQSGNNPLYRTSLVHRSHQILKMGYDLLDYATFAGSEEEVITGRLTKAMQDALQDVTAPKWSKNFWPVEEVRVNDGDREGKRRLRIDIEVVQHQHGPRPRFRFEAKRLRDSTSRRDYLGDEGLGCFLDGRYAAGDPDAGMLGYVQESSTDDHSINIANLLSAEPTRYAITVGGEWKEHQLVKGLGTYASIHQRAEGLPQIVVFHTLLLFCQPSPTE